MDFTESSIFPMIPAGSLRLMLWAGDCSRNGVTDIERLHAFDVYLCRGYYQDSLQENIDYNRRRANPAIICVIDVTNKNQMDRFLDLFRGRFSVINSDYHGNTPTLPLEYYKTLLAIDGKAFNLKGINSLIMPSEDFLNTLELFAPILNAEDRERRQWTEKLIQLGKDNDIPTSFAWSSPDFKHSYYDDVRVEQERFNEFRKTRNPIATYASTYSADTIEDYWVRLPLNILTVNYERAASSESVKGYITEMGDRFREFLLNLAESYLDDANKGIFRDYLKYQSIHKIQTFYELCATIPGIQFGYHIDTRKNEVVFGHWIKNNASE